MLVSFKWSQAGRRGSRISKHAPVARTLLTGLTLTAATASLATGPAASAASFDDPSTPSGTTSVLLHDPLEREPASIALNPPPTIAESVLADDPAEPSDTAQATSADDDASDCPGGHAAAGCTDGFCTIASGCTAAIDGSEACGCPACTGSGPAGADGGLVGTLGDWCHTRSRGPLADCDPQGLLQRLAAHHKKSGACWTGRADVILMWRNAPPAQPLYSAFDPATSTIGAPVFNANQLESTLAAGPRFSLFRTDRCGHAWETTYFRAFNFRSQEQLPIVPNGYALTPPGVFGNSFTNVSAAAANLGSGIQSWELNHRRKVANNLSLLAGFRWVEWRESLSLLDAAVDPNVPSDIYFDSYSTNCMNSLYGGQIGFDTHLIQLGSWLRVDSWMKGGAYYNNAVQTSVYQTGIVNGAAEPAIQTSAQVGAAAFVGELGMMGTIPLTRHFDLQFGYLGLWLESLAQPTNQLFGQTLVSGQPPSGSITTTGGTVVQGFTLGLAGRW